MTANDERAEFLRKLDSSRDRIERLILELQIAPKTWTVDDVHRGNTLGNMLHWRREIVDAEKSIKQGGPITNRIRALERRISSTATNVAAAMEPPSFWAPKENPDWFRFLLQRQLETHHKPRPI